MPPSLTSLPGDALPDTGPTEPATEPASGEPVVSDPLLDPLATRVVEVKRVVPASGNLSIGRQQVWLGPERGVAASGVVVADPAEHLQTGVAGGRPVGPALECLALQRGIE